MLYRSRNACSDSLEFKAQDALTMEKSFMGFCKGGLTGYFENITGNYVILKNKQ